MLEQIIGHCWLIKLEKKTLIEKVSDTRTGLKSEKATNI